MLNIFHHLNIIIPKEEKKKIPLFLSLNIITMILETLSIAMIIPLVSIISSGTFIYENEISRNILEILGNPPREKILIITMILFGIVFFLKNFLIGLFLWWQYNFAHNLQLTLSTLLFEKYLSEEYLFHTRTNSANLIRNTSQEPNGVRSAVIELFTIIKDTSIVVGIVSLLIYYDPINNSFILGILLGISFIFYLITKNRVKKWGAIRLEMSGQNIKDLNQGFGGIKEIKILGKESFFINIFKNNLKKLTNMNILNGFVRALPKLILELLGVLVLFIFILILTTNVENSLEKTLTSLSLFALSIFKILPSCVRILSSTQTLRFRMASIELLSNEIQNFDTNNYCEEKIIDRSSFLKEPKVLELKNISFSYGRKNEKSLKDISLNIEKDSILGVFGQSGSGKSTLINIILGLIKPDSGEILFNQKNISQNIKLWQSNIGFIPQNIYLVDDTIKKNIALGIEEEKIDKKLIDKCIKMSELSNFISKLPKGIETVVGERGTRVSGGELQRIGIARALYRDPKILILDEATSSLDIINEKKIMDTIQSIKLGKILIFISHRQSIYEYCTKIVEIESGQIKLIK